MNIEPLTREQAESLDTGAVQRLLGELDGALYEVGKELQECLLEYNKISGQVNILKFKKEILVERARNLKNILRSG